MNPTYTVQYESFVLAPGVTTGIIACIVIALALWAKRRDEIASAAKDNEEPRPPA